jgi:hypothetical protein
MMDSAILSVDQVNLERRRRLARRRQAREFERKKFLAGLLRAEHRAVQLRQSIARIENGNERLTHSDLGRFLDWTRNELLNVEKSIHPSGIAQALRQSGLFPEGDQLNDPLGDPPPQRPWGR